MVFVGFGTKAAIFPLGDWLPDAHPAAPSPISCLLSGVMIKLGVYGLLRIFFWMAPSSHTYTVWGGVIALFGAVSLFVGTMEALAQHDSKRLLAFHSMGQMGYIFLGIGIGIAFLRISPALSAAGFIGGLYHLVNHACFKGLLFLNAGSALIRGGTREIDRLGGLAKYMPLTAATAIIASFAIAGVPPLNGFGSKWLIYQASLFSGLQIAGLSALRHRSALHLRGDARVVREVPGRDLLWAAVRERDASRRGRARGGPRLDGNRPGRPRGRLCDLRRLPVARRRRRAPRDRRGATRALPGDSTRSSRAGRWGST